MAEINDLTIVDASNTARFPENMAPSAVNNGARALEGIVARWHRDINGSKATTGSSNAYVFAANQTLSSYFDGLMITFDANHTNSGAATLNVDSVSADAIVWPDGTALSAGDIQSGAKCTVIHDGTNWQLLTVTQKPGTAAYVNTGAGATAVEVGAQDWTAVASATTTDIGAAATARVNVTGTTTITGLGTATAGLAREVRFDGALTLTYNATSLILPGNANITTAAGDTAKFVSEGSGNWRCLQYTKRSGAAVVTGFTGFSSIEKVVKTSDETVNNSTTFQDDDELLLSLAANETVYFDAWLRHNTGSTPDIKFDFTFPSGATFGWQVASVGSADEIAASGTGASITCSGGDEITILRGYVVNGANAGNIQLQWAQDTANVSDTKVLTSSILTGWRV